MDMPRFTLLVLVSPILVGADDWVVARPMPKSAFEVVQWDVRPDLVDPALGALTDDQVHDAYDADRDGTWLRMEMDFIRDGEVRLIVPAFAARSTPAGAWTWSLRWAADAVGEWSWRAHLAGSVAGRPIEARLDGGSVRIGDKGLRGYLRAPLAGSPWVREGDATGGSRATWLFGTCRAWVVASDPAAAGWGAHEGLDRQRDLLPALRGCGMDLLSQWMAPWEYLLVHRDRAEHWRREGGSWERHELPESAPWRAWSCFDQGRAAAFDRLVADCAEASGREVVRLMLAALPHQCLQTRRHPWGSNESGWSVEDDGGLQEPQKLDGFSAFAPAMDVWDMFAADPAAPADDPRRRLFDAQANFQRYLVARWGASPAIGMWVLVDELDAVGDELGMMARGTGWWRRPEPARWLADQVRLWRGELVGADGMRYAGDPWRRPLHAATTSQGGGTAPGANLEWDGGLPEPRVDVIGWHWYPHADGDAMAWWTSTVDGVLAFTRRGGARLISEFGVPERSGPHQAPNRLQPTIFHMAAWAAVCAGATGIPMDWNDGKEFGEVRWREGDGPFGKEQYPIDLTATVAAIRSFLAELDPELLVPAMRPCAVEVAGVGRVRACALASHDGASVNGWALAPNGDGTVTVGGLVPGTYDWTWIDPWTGGTVGTLSMVVDGSPLVMRLDDVLASLRRTAPVFPVASIEHRGFDVAFRCRRAPAP